MIAGNQTLGQSTSWQEWGDSYRCNSSLPRTCKYDMTRPIAQTLLHGYLGLRTSAGEMKFHPRVPTRSNQPTKIARRSKNSAWEYLIHSSPSLWERWMPQMGEVETLWPWLSWSQHGHHCWLWGDYSLNSFYHLRPKRQKFVFSTQTYRSYFDLLSPL